MIPYFVILFLLIIISLLCLYKRDSTSLNSNSYLFIFIILVLFAGIRYKVGVDYISYNNLYNLDQGLYDMKEKGFIHINEILNKNRIPFYFLTILFSFFSVLFTFSFIKHESKYIFLSILIYYCFGNFYFSTFNAIRQGLSIPIFLNMLLFVRDKNLIYYFLVMLFTSFFVHYSILLLAPLYFILTIRFNILIKLSIIIVSIFSSSIIIALISISSYSSYLLFENFASPIPITYYIIFILSIILFIHYLRQNKLSIMDIIYENINFIFILLFIQMIIFNNSPLIMILNRIIGYFTLTYVVLIPNYIHHFIKDSNRKILYILCVIIFSSFCILSLYLNGYKNLMVPYRSIYEYLI